MQTRDGNALLYKLVRWGGSPFRYHVRGLEHAQRPGPAIYVCNHLGSLGPVAAILSMPVRFHPWAIGEMTDSQRAPQYLYDDFVHPAWHLSGRTGMAASRLLSKVSVRLLNGLGCIPVDSNRGQSLGAFRQSLALLLRDRNLLIFPENARLPEEPEARLHPFNCGFVGLCSMYKRAAGRDLPLYPLAVFPARRTIDVGTVIWFEDTGDRRRDVRTTCQRLHTAVREMYLGLKAGA